MARGWESKSVEEQQSEMTARGTPRQPRASPAELLRVKQEPDLLLARIHTADQLQKATNPRHRKVLEDALAALDSKIAGLG